ncbi:unnamed protein product [Lactuca virosa]|uniref:Uncharacterized protein n=1 Tax=Lactuca virosa TaxID=75947 RepID=A0AAU9PJ21_9ASTR|nr:unnamed protein product [Lactuca virosa]
MVSSSSTPLLQNPIYISSSPVTIVPPSSHNKLSTKTRSEIKITPPLPVSLPPVENPPDLSPPQLNLHSTIRSSLDLPPADRSPLHPFLSPENAPTSTLYSAYFYSLPLQNPDTLYTSCFSILYVPPTMTSCWRRSISPVAGALRKEEPVGGFNPDVSCK